MCPAANPNALNIRADHKNSGIYNDEFDCPTRFILSRQDIAHGERFSMPQIDPTRLGGKPVLIDYDVENDSCHKAFLFMS